jgi:RIO-like serine/threonine protein kinase
VERVLKRDALGRVELVREGGGRAIRRVACGGRVPGSALVARYLLERERRALAALAGLDGVPELRGGARADLLLRSFVPGVGLHEATWLPRDFFERLEELVRAVHASGVCHNDLHKEQNVLVREDGSPALVDFQLASVHVRRGRSFESRCREDLRHVAKTRRRYELRGRPRPRGETRPRRGVVAWTWMKVGKPVYHAVTTLFGARDEEPRRRSSGPWPEWREPPAGP